MPMQMKPQYNTVLFNDVYEDVDTFLEDYQNNGINTTISDTSATTLFYLLFARYGNNPIANYDITQFKYKLFAIIFQYGPTWEKRLDIQTKIRGLSDEEIMFGGKAIYNHAYNPSSAPSTDTLEEINYINDQNTTKHKKSKLEAYSLLNDLLENDVTEFFLDKFKYLFKQFVAPENPLLYITEEENLEV